MWYTKKQREAEFALTSEIDDMRVVYSNDFGLVKFESGQGEWIMTTIEAEAMAEFILNIKRSNGVWIQK